MKKPPRIRILVVDDHFVVRMGLKGSIEMEPDMEVVAEAATGRQAIEFCRQHRPDIVLLDVRLPGLSGIETTRAIGAECRSPRVIMLSTYDGDEDIHQALQAGAWSYLLKTAQREELLQAIRTVHSGQRYIPPEVAAHLAESLHRKELTPREREVLELIVKGKSNKEIAAALSITEVTVKLHVSGVLNKLDVNDRTQAATAALQRGIVHLN